MHCINKVVYSASSFSYIKACIINNMDIIAVLPSFLIGLVVIIVIPFSILLSIILRVIENESKGLLTMLGGFLMMCVGYLFMFVIVIAWNGSDIISTAITTESLVFEANFMGIALFSIPVVWVIASAMLMKEGYKSYKESRD